jgi:hypothetical protein
MTGLRFLFRVTLRRLDLVAEIYHLREPQKIPQVISLDPNSGSIGCIALSEVMGQQRRCREDNDDDDLPWVEKPHRN